MTEMQLRLRNEKISEHEKFYGDNKLCSYGLFEDLCYRELMEEEDNYEE